MSNDMNVNAHGVSPTDIQHLRALYELSDEKDLIDILMSSSIAQSPEQAVMLLYAMGIPVLPRPSEDGAFSWTVNNTTLESVVAGNFAKIGSDLWDSYLDHLAEQKERIADYLKSPQYRQKLELQSPAFLAYVERNTPIDTMSQARNASQYQEWLSTLPPAARDEEVGRIQIQIDQAKGLWNNVIDATSNLLSNYREEIPDAMPFIAASFVITATFIGDYSNIVDVASTKMVAVNPIQDSAIAVMDLVPQSLQQQVTLAINFFAIGLMNFANAEAIAKQMNPGGQNTATKEAVLAFANSVIDKVQSNEVNYFLTALLVNNLEKGQLAPQDIHHLTRVVKVAMLSVALAALYKFEAGSMTDQEFRDLLDGKMDPRTEEEKQLVALLQDIYGEGLQESDGNYADQWRSVMDNLVAFIMSKPSVEDLINPTTIWAQVGSYLKNPETRG
jgi:hypothetical protein